jgi:hypothetical protein
MNDYNTQKAPVILKEYGRNVQMLVDYLNSIKDRDKRNISAKALVDLMKQINPSVKEGSEDTQKLWDDLFIMSDFELDIDSPFPKPKPEILLKKPERLRYHNKVIFYKHYGLNIQLLVDYAIGLENKNDQEAAIIYIGRLMKSFASFWNRENLDDSVIINNIKELSGGKLEMDINKVKENNLFNSLLKEKPRNNPNNSGGGKGKRPRRKRN